ncbi:hypothetical protein DL96DRAFT_1820547 [Flagelloscypha sp. PMI_526]|nr:hypothetical protein DL96DRAFT_1820547 [Flagelloscypha sp. PMI_526]
MHTVSVRSEDTGLSGLSGLGLDVLTEICHFVHDTSRADIFSLILVGQLFHDVAMAFTVRDCSISFDANKLEASRVRISSWIEPNNNAAWVLPHIRHFTIVENPYEDSWAYYSRIPLWLSREEKWGPILLLIPSLCNLIQFTFACAQDRVPAELLRTLETAHPQVRLTVKHWGLGRYRERKLGTLVVDPDEEALIRSPLLCEIEKDHTNQSQDESYGVLTWIVAHSIHLESVVIHRRIVPGRRYGGAGMIRLIEERRLDDIFVLPPTIRKRHFKCLHLLHGFHTFADFCLRHTNLSSLQDLQCSFPSRHLSTLKAFHRLTSLRRLKLKVGFNPFCSLRDSEDFCSLLKDFISACGQLESLFLSSAWSLLEVISTIVAYHGPSLQSFTLLHAPRPGEASGPIPLSTENILCLAKGCVSLRELTLTASRALPISDFTKELGRFACLSNLTLMFPDNHRLMYDTETLSRGFEEPALLEENDISEWETTIALYLPVPSSFALKIFEEIVGQGCQLERLHVELGDNSVRSTAQRFIVNLDTNGKVNVESPGYVLPENADVDWKPDPEVLKLTRLQRLWDALLPKGRKPPLLET